ncbi:hypothetical protein B0H14DRAFT_2555335 [Mycena olivaceomarginata]|nr:hypothetical protein B0H14DRAFT_2555335 [Mycena olivaceomarginata]
MTLLNGQESSDLPSDEFRVVTKTGEFNCKRIHEASLFECMAVQGSILQASAELQQLMICYAQFTGVPVLPGSQLHGVFTWAQRDLMVTPGISAAVHASSSIHNTTSELYYQPLTTIFTPDITRLQTTYPANESSPNNATLTLFQRPLEVMRLLQDTVDATALSDIATFGGFWTLCLHYFLVQMHFTSCLRHHLVCQWHKDFPAIHTEGGLPSSKSAGIIAFIHEHLVDLREDPHVPMGSNNLGIEAHKHHPRLERWKRRTFQSQFGIMRRHRHIPNSHPESQDIVWTRYL